MHLDGLGKTDRLTGEPFDPGPQGEMLPLDLLRMPLARAVYVSSEMTHVCAPIVGIIAGDPKRLQERLQVQEHLVLTSPEDIGQDLATAMIDGMPQPSRVFRTPDERPHLIDFVSEPHDHVHRIWVEYVQETVVYTAER